MVESANPLDELIAATARKRDAEEIVNKEKAEIDRLKPQVSESFLQSNTRSVRKDDFLTYLSPKFGFKMKDGVTEEDLIRVLDELGYEDMVQRKSQYKRICSMLKEMDENDEEVPEELLELIEYGMQINVIVRKS